MPKLADLPKNLRAYQFHGVLVNYQEGREQAIADCPFCGKDSKFYINVETGLWDCKVCRTGSEKGGGNVYTFIRQIWETGDTKGIDNLASNRKLLSSQPLIDWGVRRCTLNDTWVVPAYNPNGRINQLYRYLKDQQTGKMRLLATPELNHGLFGVNNFDKTKPNVYLCEGPWDGAALWEVLGKAKEREEGGLAVTSSVETSLLKSCNVLAVPGANVFVDGWVDLFEGRSITLLYDNDHPLSNNGRKLEGAGLAGMKKATARLASAESPPNEIKYLSWGRQGYDPDLPNGTDIRDLIVKEATATGRVKQLQAILAKVEPVPEAWAGERRSTDKGRVGEMDCLPCSDWGTMVMAWRKALKWTEGLDRALSVMLASVVSTKAVGDQLWLKIIGPAACGKSTLCEALSVNRKYVLAKSTIRGFHSGFKSDAEGKEDNSLVAQLYGKTLVTKDGDTLLQSPNLGQILSEARDLYDSTSRTHYRNKMQRDYQGVRMTWILCGTSSLRSIDSSELGERFLDCVIMDGIDDDLEDAILLRKANQAYRCMSFEADGKLETQHDPDLVAAMQLTGGYVGFLRENAKNLISKVGMPTAAMNKCMHLAKFVAYMRARPSTRQDESAEREFATRLVSQLIRLATSLAAVLNRKTVDEEVLRRVTRVALDTARGRTLDIARHLYTVKAEGMELRPLAVYTKQTEDSERRLLKFLSRIGAVEVFNKDNRGLASRPRWRLTKRIISLYEEVVVNSGLEAEVVEK